MRSGTFLSNIKISQFIDGERPPLKIIKESLPLNRKTMPRGQGRPKRGGRGRPRGLSFTTRRRSGIWKEPDSTIVVTEHSEAVEAVKRKHAELKKMEAMDILQNNFEKTKRLIDAATHQYVTSIWNPSKDACCAITGAHNDIWGLNPALYRIASKLQRIRFHSETTNYTIYDMKADLKCRRVSIDGEVKNFSIKLSLISVLAFKTSLSFLLRLTMSSQTMIRLTVITITRFLRLVTGPSCLRSTVKPSSSSMKTEQPNASVVPKKRKKKNSEWLALREECHERPENVPDSFNQRSPNPSPVPLITHILRLATHVPAPRNCSTERHLQIMMDFSKSTYLTLITKKFKKKRNNNALIEQCSNYLQSLLTHRLKLYVFNAPGVKNKTLVLQYLSSLYIFYKPVPLDQELLVSCARLFFVMLTFLWNRIKENQSLYGGARLPSTNNDLKSSTLVTVLRKIKSGALASTIVNPMTSNTQTSLHTSSTLSLSDFSHDENECKRNLYRHACSGEKENSFKRIRDDWTTDFVHRRVQRTHCDSPQLGPGRGHHDRTWNLVPVRKLRAKHGCSRRTWTRTTDRTLSSLPTSAYNFKTEFLLYDLFNNIVRKKNHLFVDHSKQLFFTQEMKSFKK